MSRRPGQFQPGNQYWKLSSPGVKKKYPTPQSLLDAAVSYFQWVEDNPLIQPKAAHHNGTFVQGELPKPRPLTIAGLRLHLGINKDTWLVYCKRDGYEEVTEWIKEVIYANKFEGAAAELFNVQIIARDLGLADRQDITSGGKEIKNDWVVNPVTTADSTPPGGDGKDSDS